MEVFWMVWRSDEVTVVEAAMFAGFLTATKLGGLFRVDNGAARCFRWVIDLDMKIGDR
jgi:hypothetical protein